MSNMTVTNIDTSNVVLSDGTFRDGLLTLAGVDTIAAGTILARDSVSLKYVLYIKGGSTNENGIPKSVLAQEIVSVGAGDVAIRPLIAGKVRMSGLIIDADGDNSNVDSAVLDQLRSYSIVTVDAQNLSILDNQ